MSATYYYNQAEYWRKEAVNRQKQKNKFNAFLGKVSDAKADLEKIENSLKEGRNYFEDGGFNNDGVILGGNAIPEAYRTLGKDKRALGIVETGVKEDIIAIQRSIDTAQENYRYYLSLYYEALESGDSE